MTGMGGSFFVLICARSRHGYLISQQLQIVSCGWLFCRIVYRDRWGGKRRSCGSRTKSRQHRLKRGSQEVQFALVLEDQPAKVFQVVTSQASVLNLVRLIINPRRHSKNYEVLQGLLYPRPCGHLCSASIFHLEAEIVLHVLRNSINLDG